MSKLSFDGPQVVSFRHGRETKGDARRGSARERGYDREWELLSKAWRRTWPYCVECEMQGRQVRCELVDHMIPVVTRPDLRLEKRNLWGLCQHCHDTVKRELERRSVDYGGPAILPLWCRNPLQRPQGYAYLPVTDAWKDRPF